MTWRLTVEEVKARLRAVHGDRVTLIPSTYVSSGRRARFVDADYGEWEAQVKGVLQGRRHTLHRSRSPNIGRPLSSADIERKLKEHHGDTVVLAPGQTYVGSHSRLEFVDVEHGSWWAMPYVVLNGHGHHPARGHLARAAASRLSTTLIHWKTGKELRCAASYEVAFVSWCNHLKVDFDWQVAFETPFVTLTGRPSTYYVDALIRTGDHAGTYVELKGHFRQEISRLKWEWFHGAHPRSELWTLDRLQELGIMVGTQPNPAHRM